MSLILSGTDGLSDVDGTAATPAIRGTDTNTGIFFPAADTVAASVGGTEGLRLTTTGLTTQQDATVYGVRVGRGAGAVSTNTAVGASALGANTSGIQNTGLGANALQYQTNNNNTALGYNAMVGVNGSSNGGSNTAVGSNSLAGLTGGNFNTAIGQQSLLSNTTASNNTAVGYQAGYSNTTGASLVALGYTAGYSSTATNNTFLGTAAGYSTTTGGGNTLVGAIAGYALTTGQGNTFIGGAITGVTDASGRYVTTGSKNTILGCYNGNQGGLDIRTASNYIVLSDGDGNPRMYWNGSAAQQNGNLTVGGLMTASVSNSSYSTVWVGENNYLGANTSRLSLLLFASSLGNAVAKDSMLIGEPTAGHILVSPNASNKSIKLIPGGWTSTVSMELQDAGSIKLGYGQLQFPATQNPSSNANTLDDYEEGTWTPTTAGDATGTISTATGEYVKVGRMVYIRCVFQITANFTSNQIGGLPFTPSGNTGISSITGATSVMNQAGADLVAAVNIDTSRLNFYTNNNTANTGGLTTTNAAVRFTIVYQANA